MTGFSSFFIAISLSFLAAVRADASNSSAIKTRSTLTEDVEYDPRLLDGTLTEFVPHAGPGFASYLAMALPFEPASDLREELERRTSIKLKSRGEAHITVITPPEFQVLRARGVTMEEIDALAADADLQRMEVNAVCIGHVSGTKAKGAKGSLKENAAYFVVVESAQLVALRNAVFTVFQDKGGTHSEFDPLKFRPHITLGFVGSDVHEANGAIKDRTSCVASLRTQAGH